MRILKTYDLTATIIETDSLENPTFKRYSSDIWENLMGMSWEPVLHGEEELESVYQKYLDTK